MTTRRVAYLGPEGTYSHLVAEKLYGKSARFMPLGTIRDVCAFVAKGKADHGVVPIENSSGGTIYETVDILLANSPRVHIAEEVALSVRLALLGRKGETIRTLYSHFAPLEHCAPWIRRNLPRVHCRTVATTAIAAQRASEERNTAAICSRRIASSLDLDVLCYPIEADVPNITVFLALSHRPQHLPGATKTSLAVRLPNVPGSLCTFLEAFRMENINLCRIVSRPIRGSPREYAFLVDVEGTPDNARTNRALRVARRNGADVRIVGFYPMGREFKS